MADTIFCSTCGTSNLSSSQYCQKCGGSLWPAGSAAGAMMAAPVMVVGRGYAGFWIRVLPLIIDYVLVRLALLPVFLLMGYRTFMGLGRVHGRMDPDQAIGLVGFGLGVAVITVCAFWLYEALMTSSSLQATVGKLIFGLKVTDEAGNRISFARATGRHFSKYLSWLILCIGFIMAGFTDRKRALHDMIAGTLVIKG